MFIEEGRAKVVENCYCPPGNWDTGFFRQGRTRRVNLSPFPLRRKKIRSSVAQREVGVRSYSGAGRIGEPGTVVSIAFTMRACLRLTMRWN